MPTTTLAITKGPTTFKGETSTHTAIISPTKETPSQTEGEKAKMETEEKVPEAANVKKELVQEPQDLESIPITIVRPITKHAPKLEMIGSSLRLQFTDTILEVQTPQPKTNLIGSSSQPTGHIIDITPLEQPESPQAAPKIDRGKGIVRDTEESPSKLMLSSLLKKETQAHLEQEEKCKKLQEKQRPAHSISYALSQYVLYALSQYVLYALSQYVLYAISHQSPSISLGTPAIVLYALIRIPLQRTSAIMRTTAISHMNIKVSSGMAQDYAEKIMTMSLIFQFIFRTVLLSSLSPMIIVLQFHVLQLCKKRPCYLYRWGRNGLKLSKLRG
ncbi:hypothetical protein Tco_0739222 [Tanacetum coccineum]